MLLRTTGECLKTVRECTGNKPWWQGSGGSYSFKEKGKDITVAENKHGITMLVDEMVGGKTVEGLVQAANADELKTKDPQAYQYYLRYKRECGGANVRVGSSSRSGGGDAQRTG